MKKMRHFVSRDEGAIRYAHRWFATAHVLTGSTLGLLLGGNGVDFGQLLGPEERRHVARRELVHDGLDARVQGRRVPAANEEGQRTSDREVSPAGVVGHVVFGGPGCVRGNRRTR